MLSALTAAVQRLVDIERGAADMIHRNCCLATELAVDQIVAVQLHEASFFDTRNQRSQWWRRGRLEDGVQDANESIYLEAAPGGGMMGEEGARAAGGAESSCRLPDHFKVCSSSIASADVPGLFASDRITATRRTSSSSRSRSPQHICSDPVALEKELTALSEQLECIMWPLAPLRVEKAGTAGRLTMKLTRWAPLTPHEVDRTYVESKVGELRAQLIEASSLSLSLNRPGSVSVSWSGTAGRAVVLGAY